MCVDDEKTSKGTHPVLDSRVLPIKCADPRRGRWMGADGEFEGEAETHIPPCLFFWFMQVS